MSDIIQRYMPRPNIVEAVQITVPALSRYTSENNELVHWLEANNVEFTIHAEETLYLQTLDSDSRVLIGNWIIKNPDGTIVTKTHAQFQNEFMKMSITKEQISSYDDNTDLPHTMESFIKAIAEEIKKPQSVCLPVRIGHNGGFTFYSFNDVDPTLNMKQYGPAVVLIIGEKKE